VASAADAELEVALLAFLGDTEGGISAVFEQDGVVSWATVGVANSDGDLITPDTAFHVASISKAFTATLVMMLVDEGRVDLDERLSLYLPNTVVGADATVRALLGHRSGIPSYTESEGIESIFDDLTRSFEPEEMLQFVAGSRGGSGEPFYYSNSNFLLLGMLIEQLYGSDLNSVLQAEIAEPLGLTRTVFAGHGAVTPVGLAAPYVPGHPGSGIAGTPYEAISSSAFAAGALVSTPSELRVFMTALLGGELVSDESLDEMTAPQAVFYGLGLEIMDLDGQSTRLGHGGAIAGYRSIMAVHPETGEILIMVANNELLDVAEFARELLASR
jgi:D-alanyl-D-alanine carboxypeptidase